MSLISMGTLPKLTVNSIPALVLQSKRVILFFDSKSFDRTDKNPFLLYFIRNKVFKTTKRVIFNNFTKLLYFHATVKMFLINTL